MMTTLFLATSTVPAWASFHGHWAPTGEVRVKQLLSERLLIDLYDVEQGGALDLELYYAVRGQSPIHQSTSDLPNLRGYLNAPISEPLKADIFIALTREALRDDAFADLISMRRGYAREVPSNLREYTVAYSEALGLYTLGFNAAAAQAFADILATPKFHTLAHYGRDRSTTLRYLSEISLLRDDSGQAVVYAQDASFAYRDYSTISGTALKDTVAQKAKIDLSLAQALVANGQYNLASRIVETVLGLAQSKRMDVLTMGAQTLLGDLAVTQNKPNRASEYYSAVISSENHDSQSPQGARLYEALAGVYAAQGKTKKALSTTNMAQSMRKNTEHALSLRRSKFVAAQKTALSLTLPSMQGAKSARLGRAVSVKRVDTRPELFKKLGRYGETENLSYIAVVVALLGFMTMILSRTRLRRARRAIVICEQNLQQSEARARKLVKKIEEKLEITERANQSKTAFLANVSHEIRTPMNGMLGMTKVLRSTTNLDRRQAEITDTIYSSGESLLNLLGNILDYSKIESGSLELYTAPSNLREMIESVATLMSAPAREKGLEIVVRYAPNAPEVLNLDIERVRQILLNLVGNAVKFTQKGHVLINVDVNIEDESAPDVSAKAVITVVDTGIGIAKANLDFVFDDFSQVDNGRNKRYGGVGIGLSIARKLTQAMDGEIVLTSKVGEGSVFRVELPISGPAQDLKTPNQSFNSGRILIVDSVATNLKILSAQVKAWGLSCTVARCAGDGVNGLLHAAQSGRAFDAVIVDERCVGDAVNGFAAKMKNHSAVADTPIILLSNLQNTETAGVTETVSKPVTAPTLLSALSAALNFEIKGNALPSPRPVAVATVPERTVRRVLVAEANPATRHVIQAFLEDKSIQLHSAQDGEQALENATTIDFDLIFMDVQLRKLDGFLATRAVRNHEQNTGAIRTPIICLTPHALGADKDLAVAVGMDDFLVKPLTPQALDEIMDKWSGVKSDIRKAKSAQEAARKKGAKIDPMVMPFEKISKRA